MREINKVASELFYKYSHIEEQTERLEKEYLKEYLKEPTVIKYSKKLNILKN